MIPSSQPTHNVSPHANESELTRSELGLVRDTISGALQITCDLLSETNVFGFFLSTVPTLRTVGTTTHYSENKDSPASRFPTYMFEFGSIGNLRRLVSWLHLFSYSLLRSAKSGIIRRRCLHAELPGYLCRARGDRCQDQSTEWESTRDAYTDLGKIPNQLTVCASSSCSHFSRCQIERHCAE